jgi:hypothetical protein
LFTAFVSRADMVAALQETLDSVEGKWARLEFQQASPSPRYTPGAPTTACTPRSITSGEAGWSGTRAARARCR